VFVTPTAPLISAIQQPLNPGRKLSDFVASDAVKAVLSPDGTTLAILTAGFNALFNAAGVNDTAASTQLIFLYNVAGVSSIRMLVWSPEGNTHYATGGLSGNFECYIRAPKLTPRTILDRSEGVSVSLDNRRVPPVAGIFQSAS
jgi:hypothetical protein